MMRIVIARRVCTAGLPGFRNIKSQHLSPPIRKYHRCIHLIFSFFKITILVILNSNSNAEEDLVIYILMKYILKI